MDDEGRIADESEEIVDDLGEDRFIGEEFVGKAVDHRGFARHIAFGIKIDMERVAGGNVIDKLDAADFGDAMAGQGVEACGFGIEDDFAHLVTLSLCAHNNKAVALSERIKVADIKERILVIRLGALGDLIFCFQAFEEIRRAHPGAEIALLTRAAFAGFAAAMPWFDRVIIEAHPRFADGGGWLKLRRAIRDFAPTRIYDLQGKRRQNFLYALLGGPFGPEWSGAAPFCKFPRLWPPKPGMHFTDFLAAQLRAAGVAEADAADLRWLDAQVGKFALPDRYAVLIPGCSPDAPHKRWPAGHYAALAQRMQAQGFEVLCVGTAADADAVAAIKQENAEIVDLSGQTNMFELAGILRRAACVVGNDTGPLHLAAALGAPTLGLFSGKSNPIWSSPPGKRVAVTQRTDLKDLGADEVFAAFEALLQHTEGEG